MIELIEAVLELRGLPADAAVLARIRGCTEVETLERWATRAREITSLPDLFDEPDRVNHRDE